MSENRYADRRIVYMGTPDFAVPPLAMLSEEGYQVVGVVTQPDKPKGRGKTLQATPVKEEALKHGIPVFQPVKVREEGFFEILRDLAPDIIIVAAFGQIIPERILTLPRFGCVNIHASLLPRYRGAAPIQHALINGDKETGVTLMQMSMGLDTGDMLNHIVVPITPEDTGGSLFDRLSDTGARLLKESLPDLFEGRLIPVPQPEESPTPYASMIRKEMGDMDFTKDAAYLERLVRGLSPWPGAYTHINGKTLKIWKSAVCGEAETPAAPGTILSAGREGIRVQCGSGILVLKEVQLEGKKRMDTDAFLRGFRVEKGTVFTRTE